jgi:peroxiredoxin Q/BCP
MTHLKVGDDAPNFEAKDQNGDIIKLNDYKGKKVVLYFYPKDDTPTCTVEACNFKHNYKMLQDKGYVVLGVSADSERKHTNFIKKYDLPFSLLSDPDRKVIEAYGVWGNKKFMGREYDGIHRETFVIDEVGKLEKVITKVKSKIATDQILE